MSHPKSLLVPAVVALFVMFSSSADAQFRIRVGNQHHDDHHDNHRNNHNNHVPPGFHVDHHNHPVRDSHGHIIGNVHHDVIHRDATHIVPHVLNSLHHGTYHLHGGNYYYTQQAVVGRGRLGRGRVVQKPAVVAFGGFSHVDDLAVRLETLANEFCLDLHYNYRHNHGFGETYGEAYQILGVAKFIHAAEHQQDRDAIRGKLGGLDALMHHVKGDVRGWSRHHRRQIGQLGIVSKMEMIESTLHHLMNDVGVHPTATGEQAPVPGGGVEQAPAPALAPMPVR